ncbi:BnaC03g69120D [Brassica napus]|uniref:BnaC03g69120D protein n=1 Tax=Brassica napus TaxID=3708 RepID=A0A078IDX8_BRANA|nr:BnaC03g69120D [Brassica napus]
MTSRFGRQRSKLCEAFSVSPLSAQERIMLKQLKFRLNEATPYVFILRFLKAAQSNKKLQQLSFYLIELRISHLCSMLHFTYDSSLDRAPKQPYPLQCLPNEVSKLSL